MNTKRTYYGLTGKFPKSATILTLAVGNKAMKDRATRQKSARLK